jgi:hypothetical protein
MVVVVVVVVVVVILAFIRSGILFSIRIFYKKTASLLGGFGFLFFSFLFLLPCQLETGPQTRPIIIVVRVVTVERKIDFILAPVYTI